MPDWAVMVIAGLALAALVPAFKFTVRAVASAIVLEIRTQLNLDKVVEDLDYVKNELTINGGETVKDRIFSIERQLERLLTDR